MRLAAAFVTVALAASSLAGCDSGTDAPSAPAAGAARSCAAAATSIEGLRVTAASCTEARRVAIRWSRRDDCRLGEGASRGGCSVGPYRCGAVRADRGIAVSCARPGRTVGFIARRGD